MPTADGSKTVTLSGEAVSTLEKLGRRLGTSTLEETLGRIIGTQAAIAEQVSQGNVVRIQGDANTINVARR